MSDAPVLLDLTDGVATITLNRPDAMNSLDVATKVSLLEAVRSVAENPAARCVVLTGSGRAFCTGQDLKEHIQLLESGGSEQLFTTVDDHYNPIVSTLAGMAKPVIAAVNGVAFAGGFLLAQMVDLVIAADHAKFAITEAKVGRGSPWAAPLPWLIPPRVAMEIMVTAKPITAQRAYELGLVNKVVPFADLRSAASAMAAGIAANAPLSVRAAKSLVYLSAEHGWSRALDEADKLYEPVYLSEDGQEGPRAFAEKRKPVWKGR
jgi:enoyl-CoA hydratase/carnithine racemase